MPSVSNQFVADDQHPVQDPAIEAFEGDPIAQAVEAALGKPGGDSCLRQQYCHARSQRNAFQAIETRNEPTFFVRPLVLREFSVSLNDRKVLTGGPR